MKKKLFSVLLLCAISAMLFSGCGYNYKKYEGWMDEIDTYFDGLKSNASGMKNIDSAHKEAFDSVFNNIEIFGARLCVPMKVSELPDKFELSSSYSEYVPLSENKSEKNRGAGLERHSMPLYYDREIQVANVSIVCEADQNIEEGIIYEFRFDCYVFPSALLGGHVDIKSDISVMKDFLGEVNEFNDILHSGTNYCTLCYTDGNRMIELSYNIQGDDTNFLTGSIRTYNKL